jgi:hypothetical protein
MARERVVRGLAEKAKLMDRSHNEKCVGIARLDEGVQALETLASRLAVLQVCHARADHPRSGVSILEMQKVKKITDLVAGTCRMGEDDRDKREGTGKG